jgi:hypothetical protein
MPTSVISTAQTTFANWYRAGIEKDRHEHIAFAQRSTAGMTVFDQADLLVVDSGMSSDTFNKMAQARLQESDVDRRMAEAVAYFTGVQRPFAWGPRLAAFESRRSIT